MHHSKKLAFTLIMMLFSCYRIIIISESSRLASSKFYFLLFIMCFQMLEWRLAVSKHNGQFL